MALLFRGVTWERVGALRSAAAFNARSIPGKMRAIEMRQRSSCLIVRCLCASVMATGFAGCTGIVAAVDPSEVSTAYEPPPRWEAAILFQFMDSTFRFAEPEVNSPVAYEVQVAFSDGLRTRLLTGRDVFHAENGSVRTPWYRVHPRLNDRATMIRITIGDAAGEQTTAEYPIMLKAGEFYFVELGVYTRRHGPGSYNAFMQHWRSYPVPAGARRAAGDSLWVGYRSRARDCFNCPG